MVVVRRAVLADAADLASLHVQCWNETYTGVLPQHYLQARSVAARFAFWRDRLRQPDPRIPIFVASAADGRLVGFASGGPERSGSLGVAAELYALYVLKSAQGQGLGRNLAEAVINELRPGVAVWVLAPNPARAFYEHIGGRLLAEKQSSFGGVRLPELAYQLA
jgi:GNAT superfamily N-acetyltransferase